ncbi:MAG: hypothetical protein Tsb0020_29600 [Haliangiales bacterium]
MSRSGRFVAIRQADGVDVVDPLGPAPRKTLLRADIIDFACVGSALWVVSEGRLERFALDGPGSELVALGEPTALPLRNGRLSPVSSGVIPGALWVGYTRFLLQEIDGALDAEDLRDEAGTDAFIGLLGGRRVLIAAGGAVRVRDVGRSDVAETRLPIDGAVVACASLFGGQAIAVLVEADSGDTVVVMRSNGALVHRVGLACTSQWAVADSRGVALLRELESGRLLAVDLRYGKLVARAVSPLDVTEIAIDADGKYVALAGYRPVEAGAAGAGPDAGPGDPTGDIDNDPKNGIDSDPDDDPDNDLDDDIDDDIDDDPSPSARPSVLHLAYTEIFGAGAVRSRSPRAASAPPADAARGPALHELNQLSALSALGGASALAPGAGDDERGPYDHSSDAPERSLTSAERAPVDAASGLGHPDEAAPPADHDEPVEIPTGPLLGLGRPSASMVVEDVAGAAPYADPGEHLDHLLDLVTARAQRAIAYGWSSGLLSRQSDDEFPYQREVYALIGTKTERYAPQAEADAEENIAAVIQQVGLRARASLARGMSLPFVELVREFELPALESQLLMMVAAPFLRGEIARLYGILTNDPTRTVCDQYLIELMMGGRELAERGRVAHALRAEGVLRKYGLVQCEAELSGQGLFQSYRVDPVLLQRLRGDRDAGVGPADISSMRAEVRALEQLCLPATIKRDLCRALAAPARDGRPYRVVLRGRRGVGRRSLAAALAARSERPLVVIDCERLPRAGVGFAAGLGNELIRALLRGAVPCVSGIEVFDSTDAEGSEYLRTVFRNHPGPIFIRTSPEHSLPLDPGYVSATIPALSESERLAFWAEALARHGLRADSVERLASRYRVGPGTIEAIIAEARARPAPEVAPRAAGDGGPDDGDDDMSAALDETARQHIQTRMSSVSTQVSRLAKWEQVALPEDIRDSIREFIGRVRHRRTVYDTWGFDSKMSTSRGLTALFYGPPGTGKSMVAGLIARELALDLYRVDLARITSKWIGETEKNLAEVFDAAEDGQCIILFDEADSLFAKRTEVKSSVDRYANLEVNYLLQRLDTFEGVAILTTNLEGSIDKAFKRRMSLRLAFPFPDEEMRVRLWAAHIPPEVPTRGDFDFPALARRFPMSGGYIRNSALRAAFLAAQEDVAMSHQHLERAIHLEYREMGKLSPGGRME